MENPSKIPDKGVLKKTLIVEWSISLELLRKKRARTDVFSTENASFCLLLTDESELPRNNMKLNVELLTRGIVEHTHEVTLSLLDDRNGPCYTVQKRLSNSTSETTKVCSTIDFGIIPHYSQKFFHNGAMRIQCCIETPECVASSLKTSKDFNKLEALLQNHLSDIVKAGVLLKTYFLTWTVSEITVKKEDEVGSDSFTFESSEFYLNSVKTKKLNERFVVCLNRKTKDLKQKLRVTLAVLDSIGLMHYAKEEVTEDSTTVFLNFGKVFENRVKFIDKGKLKIYCSLQIENISEVSNFAVLKSGETPGSSKMAVLSNAEKKITPSPAKKLFSKTMENPCEKSGVETPKSEEESKIEGALSEMLQLIHEAQVDYKFASSIISLLFSTAREDYKGTITEVLLDFLIKNDCADETDFRMISRNMRHISVTEQWLSFLRKQSELANVVIQRLAFEK